MKKITPIIITFLICLYVGLYSFGLFYVSNHLNNTSVKLVVLAFGIISLLVIGSMLWTLKSRLKELKEEDQDDISKY